MTSGLAESSSYGVNRFARDGLRTPGGQVPLPDSRTRPSWGADVDAFEIAVDPATQGEYADVTR